MEHLNTYSDDDSTDNMSPNHSIIESENVDTRSSILQHQSDEHDTANDDYLSEDDLDIIDMESYVLSNKIPMSHQVDLSGHDKAVVSLSLEPSGTRLVSGSLDYHIKLYDFGGMDSRHRAFRSIEPDSGHPITSISHSPNGDRFVVATGSAQCIVYDREGTEIIKFAKGDMYIRDLIHTKGHTMEVTCVKWHPKDKNIILSSSLDGSIRIWDLLGEAHFGHIISKFVLKLRPSTGQGRLGATACTYTPNGKKIIGGAMDGTIFIWNEKKQYARPDITVKPPYNSPGMITSLCIANDNSTLASRGHHNGNTIYVWDLTKPQKPIFEIPEVPNEYPTANMDFSEDSKYLCCGTTPISREVKKKDGDKIKNTQNIQNIQNEKNEKNLESIEVHNTSTELKGESDSNDNNDNNSNNVNSTSQSYSSLLCFYDLQLAKQQLQQQRALLTMSQKPTFSTTTNATINSMSSSSMNSHKKDASFTTYPSKTSSSKTPITTNATTTTTSIKNNQMTEEALVLSPNIKIGVKRNVSVIIVKWAHRINQIFCSTSDGAVRTYFDPRFSTKGAMLTSTRPPKREKDPADSIDIVGEIINPHALPMYRNDFRLTKKRDAKELLRKKNPIQPQDTGPNKTNNSFFFTQYIMHGRAQDTLRLEDPREALIKLDTLTKEDPMYLGRSYEKTQPMNRLMDMTLEEEQEEFKKKQKRLL